MKLRKTSQFRSNGFTMMEMVLVLAIIALLMGLTVGGMGTFLTKGRITRARGDLGKIISSLELYQVDNFAYPSTSQGLKALVEKPTSGQIPRGWSKYLGKEMIDPWGQPYRYRNPGTKSTEDGYDVFSPGPDKQVDTDDDIGNWTFQ